MKRFTALIYAAALALSLGVVACATSSFERIDLNDLPETPFEITVYRSATKGLAVILDEPRDRVLITVIREKHRAKKEGLKTFEGYLEEFIWTPKVYRLVDKQDALVLGYLLISPELKWLIRYDKDERKVNIWITDPYDVDIDGHAQRDF